MKQVTNMKISTDFPPNILHIEKAFGPVEQYKPIFCYGDTIYNPYDRNITPDIEVHEEVHSKQQGNSPEAWYFKYLNNTAFRLKQEIEAYGVQYHWINTQVDKETGEKIFKNKLIQWQKEKMADALSSASYGNMISFSKAESAIRNYAKNI